MKRVPEPELMDDLSQASAYAETDFSEPDRHFVDLLRRRCGIDLNPSNKLAEPLQIVDLGCGPGNIALRLVAALDRCVVLGVDGAGAMIDIAEQRRRSGTIGAEPQKPLIKRPS